jgi:hypothetical protein
MRKGDDNNTVKAWRQENTENSHIGHCTHISESIDVKVNGK